MSDALPRLRQDLRLERAAPLWDGAPCWTLVDPVAHRYYQLGQREVQVLGLWKLGTVEALSAQLHARGAPLQPGELAALLHFLEHHGLIEAQGAAWRGRLLARHRAQQSSGLQWLLHHYLFFRVPLLRPGAFLRRTLPWVRGLWSPLACGVWALLALLGLTLVGRQWDSFEATFAEFLSWRGLVAYGVGAVLVKTVHEFGHAYAATHFGCRVPTMGVAVMMGMPMLYSDTTASWRLRRRSARLWIDAAGVIGELAVAVVATVLWAFVPDGWVRGTLFVLATTSWLLSLAINLNPFMRFDGYYLLADALGLPNLQTRAFDLARWQLRRWVLGWQAPAPESLPPRLRWGLVGYAWAVWVYRLVLYAGIALAVYHFFFKALGLVLFAVEMGWFIVRPVGQELALWWRERAQWGGARRPWGWAALLLAGLGLVAWPLDRQISVPAVLAPTQELPLFVDVPSRIEQVLVHNGEWVQPGQVLLRLASPTLQHEQALAQTRAALAQARLNRIAGAPRELAQAMVLARELQVHQRTLQALQEQSARLEVRAPWAGRVVDMEPTLAPGLWVDRRLELGRVVAGQSYDVRAYVPETDAWRVEPGRWARFIADDPGRPVVAAQVMELRTAAVEALDQPRLSSVFDGPIATREDAAHRLVPVQAQYPLRLQVPSGSVDAAAAWPAVHTGQVVLEVKPQSWLAMAAAQVLRVLARETDW